MYDTMCANPHLGGVTMLHRVSVLALVLALAACGDDEPDVLDPQDLRILIVRGDGQVSEVAPSPYPSADVVMSVRYAKTPDPSTVLPDTLVARITGPQPSVSLTGPSFAVLPANTMAHFRPVLDQGCGEPWISSAIPDENQEVRTLWVLPTVLSWDALGWHNGQWGARCEMEVRVTVANEFVRDTVFWALFTPGPIARTIFRSGKTLIFNNKTPFRPHLNDVSDWYGNPIPWAFEVDCDCLEVLGTIENFPSRRELRVVGLGSGTVRVIVADGSAIAEGTVEVRQSGELMVATVTLD